MKSFVEKLAEQADLLGDFTPTKIPGNYAGTISVAAIEKFAELIIRDIIGECTKYSLVDSAVFHLRQKYGIELDSKNQAYAAALPLPSLETWYEP